MKIIDSFTYLGPNRRADVCLIENLLELEPAEQQIFQANAEDYRRRILATLRSNGISVDAETLSCRNSDETALEIFAGLYAGCALAVQQAAGHKLEFMGVTGDLDPNRVRSMFEFEQSDVGDHADLLVHKLLAKTMPELDWTIPDWDNADPDKPFDFDESFANFKLFSRQYILPRDAQTIIDTAAKMDIPCVKLERDPYKGLEGDLRVRKNGLLKLGHSMHNHIVDGTFCVDKGFPIFPLLRDRMQVLKLLSALKAPIAPRSSAHPTCLTFHHAVSCAKSLGFPVIVKPRLRKHGQGISPAVTDENALRAAVEKARQTSDQFIVEQHVSGKTYKAIVANGKWVGVVAQNSARDLSGEFHPETIQLVLRLATAIDVGVSVTDIVTTDINLPLQETGGAIVDLDISPELDGFLPADGILHRKSISAFVSWIFPEGSVSRIPLVSITGSNGKTTTSRMIDKIMVAAQYQTGMANSDGIYFNGDLSEAGIFSGLQGHLRILESNEINMGVLETARGAIVGHGFMYDWCNVAVCLNVTMDHIGDAGIESVSELAVLKRSIVETARDGAVLYADDEHCLGMVPFLSCPKICLVSLASNIAELRAKTNEASSFALVEKIESVDWLVFYDNDIRTPVVTVDDVPSAYGGKAAHNVSNALHALAAAYFMGVDLQTISKGLQDFAVGFESSPGRLTFYHEHPFTVLLDYAHNPDSFSKLGDFVGQLDVTGRKILMFQARDGYGDVFIEQLVAATAGHFDHYICRSHPGFPGRGAEIMAALMKEILLTNGVQDHQVNTFTDPDLAVTATLEMATEGDLLVFCPGVFNRKGTWDQIKAFKPSM